MGTSKDTFRWLVDPKVSRPAYWLVHAAGAAQLLGGGGLVIYGESIGEWVLAGLLALGGLLFIAVAGILGARKGGVAYSESNGNVRVYGRSVGDFLEVPAAEIDGLRVIRRREFWGGKSEPLFVCSVELACRSRVSILLLELSNLEDAQDVALTFREVTGWKVLTDGEVAQERRPEAPRATGLTVDRRPGQVLVTLRPGLRYALSLVTLSLALLSLVTGVLLLAAVESTGVAGFLFGPFLGALGLCCLLLWLFHVLGGQRLDVAGGQVSFAWFLGGWQLGRTELAWSAEARARIRTRAALGFAVELVSGDRIVSVGAGATSGSAVSPTTLLQLAEYLLAQRQNKEGTENE